MKVKKLASVPTVLGGMLHATFDVESEASGYGTWTLEVLSDDLGTLDASLRTSVNVGGEWVHHLKANVVRDFILVCHYLA